MKLSYQNEIALNTGAFAMSEEKPPFCEDEPTLESLMGDLIETLLTVRESRGNEAQAMLDWEADTNLELQPAQREFVCAAVNLRWNYVRNRRVQYRR